MTTTAGPHVGILVFDDADELDVVGPFSVLTRWVTRSALQPTVATFSADGGGVRLMHGLRVVPAVALEDVGPLHVLIHPGGPGVRTLLGDPEHLAWLRAARVTTPVVVGVGTGALTLAAAGLLAGRPVTTRRGDYDELVRIDPSVVVDTEAPYVDDGDVVTSGAAAAGIDVALHLVARLESSAVSHTVRQAISHHSLRDLDDGL